MIRAIFGRNHTRQTRRFIWKKAREVSVRNPKIYTFGRARNGIGWHKKGIRTMEMGRNGLLPNFYYELLNSNSSFMVFVWQLDSIYLVHAPASSFVSAEGMCWIAMGLNSQPCWSLKNTTNLAKTMDQTKCSDSWLVSKCFKHICSTFTFFFFFQNWLNHQLECRNQSDGKKLCIRKCI